MGLYGPGSMSWRINRERALLLLGPRALLMQLAHPRVAAGVDEHSDFRVHPFRRLARTMTLNLNSVFGDTRTALAAVRRINGAHEKVRGVGYSAMDADLLTWVMATLVDSAVLGYETFVEPLDDAEKDRFYAEARSVGRLLGTPQSAMPPDFRALRRYVDAVIASGEVGVDDVGRGAARDTLYPPRVWFVPRPVFDSVALLTAAFLPDALRVQYGMPWSARRRAAVEAFVQLTRSVVPRLPPSLRYVPQARAAAKRVGIAA